MKLLAALLSLFAVLYLALRLRPARPARVVGLERGAAVALVLLVIAPAFLARGGQMKQYERGAVLGIGSGIGAARFGIKIEWRVLA